MPHKLGKQCSYTLKCCAHGRVFLNLCSGDDLWSEKLQRMVCEITLKQSNSLHYLPHHKMVHTPTTHVITAFEGWPKF